MQSEEDIIAALMERRADEGGSTMALFVDDAFPNENLSLYKNR